MIASRLFSRLAQRVLPVACAALLAVAPAAAQTPADTADATYAGTLPCADCAGQAVVLTLFADGSFRMRTTYVDAQPGQDHQVYDIGRWASDGPRKRVLRGGREAPWQYGVEDDGSLRLLDLQGRPIASRLNYTLRRQPGVDPLPGPMRVRGLYSYMADAASLTECRTGKRWPVLIEGDHLALERAYLAQRSHPGDFVLAAAIVRFETREPEPGARPREFIRVEQFERLWPRETCAQEAPAKASLLNTRWRVVEVDGQPVNVAAGQREPHFRFDGEGRRVRGFGGCSDLAGRFEQGADGFLIPELSVAGGSCPAAAAEQEAGLVAALRAVASSRIVGDALQLRDATGRVRVRAEALYLR